jgi:hypothetical protein
MCEFYCEVMGLDPSLHPSEEEQARINTGNDLTVTEPSNGYQSDYDWIYRYVGGNHGN